MNKLHIAKKVRLAYGMTKMPFTLAKPLKLSTLQKKLKALAAKSNAAVAKVHMCNPTYGFVTFAPIAA